MDFILTLIIATGAFFLLSSIFNYDSVLDDYNSSYSALVLEVKDTYGVDFEAISKMTDEEYQKYVTNMTEDEKVNYENAQKYVQSNEEINMKFQKIFSFTILVVTFGIMIGFLIVEFLIPLFLKNGQTVGKKIFGICLMMENGVRVKPLPLLIRTLLGKYTIETMLAVYAFLLLFLFRVIDLSSILLLLLVGLIALSQPIIMIFSKKNALIHDLMAYTVVVDRESQMIFNTEEELIKYKQDLADKNARSRKTF